MGAKGMHMVVLVVVGEVDKGAINWMYILNRSVGFFFMFGWWEARFEQVIKEIFIKTGGKDSFF
jgi:hypothetical protein